MKQFSVILGATMEPDMNASVELCMLICSSKPYDSKKDEIHMLLTTGADINFQDANRSFNTPLHLAIERRNIPLIKLLLHFNPSTKIRNMNGERPRDLALNLNFFDIAKLLDDCSREPSNDRQSASIDDQNFVDIESFDSGVSEDVQPDFNARNVTHYTSSRVQYLLSVTKIDPHFKRTSFDMDSVKEIYAKLDENIFLRPLLKIAKEIRRLEIYFLFDHLNNELAGCSINELNGSLFIYGSRNGSGFAALLAHKLLHYALNHINDNDCKPYRRKQSEKMFRFKKIVTVYKRKIECLNPVVQHVFELPEAAWDAELIACVPYFLAFYHNEPSTLNDIIEAHKELFDFYHQVVLQDFDDYLVQSNLKKFRGRPVEGSSFGITRPYDPYKIERLEEKYGSNYRGNKRNNRDLEKICAIL